MPLVLGVQVGQAVQIGDVAAVKVVAKEGSTIRLGFFTDISPIRLLPPGIVPQRFLHGIRRESREPMPGRSSAQPVAIQAVSG